MRMAYAVRNIMTKGIVCLESTANVNEAVKLMVERDIASVVVTKGGKMVGILTERDVLKKCCPRAQCTRMKAADIMTSPLITIDADSTIGEAADLMQKNNIRRLLVTEGGTIQGIITERDAIRATVDWDFI